jgi:hypothetical protein
VRRFKDRSIKEEYRRVLKQQLENRSTRIINNVEVKWKAIKQGIHTAAEEVLGTTQPKPWTDGLIKAAKQRRI